MSRPASPAHGPAPDIAPGMARGRVDPVERPDAPRPGRNGRARAPASARPIRKPNPARETSAKAARPDLRALERLIKGGEVDTVLVCMPDMQGRLAGKRLTARHLLESLGHDVHACDYLLAVDMEMAPVPGMAVSSWETGFGDFSIRPNPATARLIPWLPGTALVLGDTVDASGGLAPHAPRTVLRRQVERLAARDYAALFASELEFYLFGEDWRAARGRRYGASCARTASTPRTTRCSKPRGRSA